MDREALMQRLGRAQAHARNQGKDIMGGSAQLLDEALRRHVERQERLIREDPSPELHSNDGPAVPCFPKAENGMSFKTTTEDSFTKMQDAHGDWLVKINLSGQLQPPIFCRDEAQADTVIREQKAKRRA